MAGWENAFGEIATAAKQDAQQTTLAAIQTAAEALLTAAAAIKVATEALNTKTTTVNTGAIAGTVALDAPTLAALETTGVAVSNFPATQNVAGTIAVSNLPGTQPVSGTVALDAPTLAALETVNAAISNFPATQPVSAIALPLPADAATETTLAVLSNKVPASVAGKLPIADVDVGELAQATLDALAKLAWLGGPARALDGSLRTSIIGTPGVTVSSGTVSTVTNQAQFGGYAANQTVPAITNAACYNNLSKMDG